MTETVSRRPSRRRKNTLVPRLVAGGSVALLITAGVLGYRASAEPAAERYRTVVAGPATVSQTISLSGTVHHVSQVSITFPTAGMVVSVQAKAGDTVAAGQPLATIDSGPLQNAVLDAEAAWRAAVSKLDTDETAYNAASTSSTTTTTATTRAAAAASSARPAASGASQAGQAASSAPASASTPRPSGSGSVRPSGSAVPTASVQDAASAIQALQTTLGSIQTNYDTFVTACLPQGLPSTAPSTLPSIPSVVTVTATQTVTVTATATKTVTVTAPAGSAPASGSTSPASSPPAAASTAATAASPAATTAVASASSSAMPSATSQPLLPSTLPVSPACQQAITALAALPQTLSDQLGAVERTMVGAQASLNAQAAALQAQATQLKQQGAALQQQAAALQQQAAALQAQAAALKAQAGAAAAQGAAAAAKLGAAGVAKVSEATLISDRANVEATSLALQQAKDRLANATVKSPIAGVVATIPWITGQSTTAVSAATIIGPGAIEITVPVALAQRPQVEVGQSATVSSTLTQQTMEGKVTRIGLLPVATTTNAAAAAAAAAAGAAAGGAGSSTTSNVSYPVIVTVPNADLLPEGSRVQVGIVTAKVAAPVTVPASAVTPTSLTTGTLQVFANGVAERRTVQIGITGGGIVQIVSGVSAGEQVVVADMELPLPGVTINTGRPTQQAQNNQGGQFPQGGGQGGQQPGGQPTR